MSFVILIVILFCIIIAAGVAYKINHTLSPPNLVGMFDLLIYCLVALAVIVLLLDFVGVLSAGTFRVR